jgi:hypothetical protein
MSLIEANEGGPLLPATLADDGPPPAHLVGLVLKAPRAFADLVAADRFGFRASLILLLAAAGFYAVYGVSMGAFSGGHTLWMTGLKVPLIALASIALCAPSLYVLLGLNGSPLSVRQAAAILAGAACLASLLLVGFAPVAWLFGVSTTSVQFMIVLHLAVAAIGILYGLRLFVLSVPNGFEGNKVLALWTAVFLLVSAQMVTYFRPLLSVTAQGQFRESEKQFFFEHLRQSVAGRSLDPPRDAAAAAEEAPRSTTPSDLGRPASVLAAATNH